MGQRYRPRPNQGSFGLELFALPLQKADEELRKSIEAVLHSAWMFDEHAKCAISGLLGLGLIGMHLRSGKQTSRCDSNAAKVAGSTATGHRPPVTPVQWEH